MGDREKKQLNNNDDLQQVKSLIGDADGDGFSLDDILAEFGSGRSEGQGAVPVKARQEEPDLPWPAAPRRSHVPRPGKVVSFPGKRIRPQEPEEDEPEPEEEKSGGMGALALVLVLVVLGGGGAFAYIKFIRPKQASKASADPDDYDFADEEEYINEDEPEEETEDMK